MQIAASAGPSGPNCEYVYKLANVMREMGVEDDELFSLETEVRRLVAAAAGQQQRVEQQQQQQADQRQHEGEDCAVASKLREQHLRAVALEAVARAGVEDAAAGPGSQPNS
jgi:hypothetical protein